MASNPRLNVQGQGDGTEGGKVCGYGRGQVNRGRTVGSVNAETDWHKVPESRLTGVVTEIITWILGVHGEMEQGEETSFKGWTSRMRSGRWVSPLTGRQPLRVA